MKTYAGLISKVHVTPPKPTEKQLGSVLSQWEYVSWTADEWIDALERGYTIQPSIFKANENGIYTHRSEFWKETFIVCLDADNVANVGTDSKNGVPAFTEHTELYERFPQLKKVTYAVLQSASSMHTEIKHRRYRFVFVFDQPITSKAQHDAVITKMHQMFPIICPTLRQPAQPVFGNAREGYNTADRFGNILTLSDFALDNNITDQNTEQADSKETAERERDVVNTHSEKQSNVSVLSDSEVLEKIRNSKQADTFNRLWQGNWDGYKSRSEADLALCSILAFYCDDISQVDSLFRDSALYRVKWERDDYRNKTLTLAWKTTEQQSEDPTANPFFKGKHGNTFDADAVADALDEQMHILALPNSKQLYIYEKGIYKPNRDKKLQRDIRKKIKPYKPCKTYFINETLNALEDRHMQAPPADGSMPCEHPQFINVKNGIIDLNSYELRPHSPDFKSLIQLPVIFNPKAICLEINKFLDDVLQNDLENILFTHQIIASAAQQRIPIPACFVFLGPTATGKSTTLELITAFLGKANVCSVSLQALDSEHRRFVRSRLYGKLANVFADLPKSSLASEFFKAVTAGDAMDVELKGIDPFTIKPFATMICAANEMPKIRDKSDAIYERLKILPFEKQHKGEKAIPNYIQKLTTEEELSGLLNHVLKAIQYIRENRTYITTESMQAASEEYRLENDSVTRFLEETYVRDVNTEQKEDDVWGTYLRFCENEGIQHASKTHVRKTFLENGIKRVRKNVSGDRCFVFKGIKK